MVKRFFKATVGYFRTLAHPIEESVFAVFLGLLVGALFMIAAGSNPIDGYISMLKGFGIFIYGGRFEVDELLEGLATATPLMLTAITFAVGMRAGLFNIGAEGQAYMGAVAAAWVGGWIALPAGLHVFAATAVAMLAGALWALLPALLKIWRGVHEVISTIMLNWTAYFFIPYFITYYLLGPWADRTAPTMSTARYSVLGASLTTVIFVAIAFCIVVYILLWRTRGGYELRLVGSNPDAARYAGVSIRRTILLSFIIGGLAAGLAGGSQVIGRPVLGWCLPATLGTVWMLGFNGIAVALIGRNHPIGGIFAAIFLGGILHGRRYMYADLKISPEFVVVLQGIIVMALAIPEFLAIIRRRLK